VSLWAKVNKIQMSTHRALQRALKAKATQAVAFAFKHFVNNTTFLV
jgi:hypothetical protein